MEDGERAIGRGREGVLGDIGKEECVTGEGQRK